MKAFIEKLLSGRDLSAGEMERAFDLIMTGEATESQMAAFLVALRAKGERPAEIAAAAQVMREKALRVKVGFEVVDTCGTGGDQACTFNISTAVALVLAGAGCKVAKHGNRSVSSSSGSADCLEALGVPIDLDPQEAEKSLCEKGFAFLFAPRYHPSMRHAMPTRTQLGIKTIFNILGPLSNPAGAAFQLMGVYDPGLIEPMINVFALMGLKGAMVVHSGLDEVSISGPTRYARLARGRITMGEITPQAAGITSGPIAALRADSAQDSAAMIEGVFIGRDTGPCLQSLLINTAAALMAVDASMDIGDGVQTARRVIASGAALAALERVRA